MTGYTVHTGSTVKFSGGWDRIFSGKASASRDQSASKKSLKKTVTQAKKTPAKRVGKKNRRTKHG